MPTTADQETEPVFPQAALGYRIWKLINGHLHPLFAHGGGAWQPGVNTAVCLPGSVFPYPGIRTTPSAHQAPAPNCKCGFNAHHQLKGALDEIRVWAYQQNKYNWRYRDRTLVLGAIAGRGHLELHAGGFRCEQAQVLGLVPIRIGLLFAGPKVGKITDELHLAAAYHQVPVFSTIEGLRDHCQGLPQLAAVPKELLPDAPPLPQFFPNQAGGYRYTMLMSAIILAFGEAALEAFPSVQVARIMTLVAVVILVGCMLSAPARVGKSSPRKPLLRPWRADGKKTVRQQKGFFAFWNRVKKRE